MDEPPDHDPLPPEVRVFPPWPWKIQNLAALMTVPVTGIAFAVGFANGIGSSRLDLVAFCIGCMWGLIGAAVAKAGAVLNGNEEQELAVSLVIGLTWSIVSAIVLSRWVAHIASC
jgi:hypothetical protein